MKTIIKNLFYLFFVMFFISMNIYTIYSLYIFIPENEFETEKPILPEIVELTKISLDCRITKHSGMTCFNFKPKKHL